MTLVKRLLLCLCMVICLLLAGCSAGKETGLTIRLDELTGDVSFIDYNAGGTAVQVIARLSDAGVPKLSYMPVLSGLALRLFRGAERRSGVPQLREPIQL